MRDIQKEIQENLDQIEKKYGVEIVFAAESGSRAWGFASPDSDYDVRFIYVRKAKDYLKVNAPKDVIEWRLDKVLDINGWDLRKALHSAGKGNVDVFEWAMSPIVYRTTPEWGAIFSVVKGYFSEKPALHHYCGLAAHTIKAYLLEDTVRYKKYFYALRPLLCCRWIRRYHEAPPVVFEKLLSLFDIKEEGLTPDLYYSVRELLSKKVLTGEKEENPHMPEIQSFVEEECRRQKVLLCKADKEERKDMAEMDECFAAAVINRL